MKVTIELIDDSKFSWTPSLSDFKNWARKTLEGIELTDSVTVSIRLVNFEDACQLNLQYRNKVHASNVLSFPADLPEKVTKHLGSTPLGDIVICPEIVQLEAKEQEKSINAHWAHILVHSIMHLKGFQHEVNSEAAVMEKHEIKVLEKLGFPNPYLVV
jgi:probable rRNA maturation factor